jgi:hypothetical protein
VQVTQELEIWIGVVAQALERLLCECEALSSNFSPTKKKKKKKVH